MARLTRLHQQFTTVNTNNAAAYFAALEEAYGNSPITITGVPDSSRFARILVAADFKMKRIALGLETSQVRNIPSYVSLISSSRPNISPHFWLTPEYAGVAHDSRKLTWRIDNPRIRASFRATDGNDQAAVNWCRRLEENYDALVRAYPVFGELRNSMTLVLVAALIHQKKLLQRADCNLTILLDDANLRLIDYPVPQFITNRSVKSRNGFTTIVACGGIEINPFDTLRNNVRLDSRIDSQRARLIQMSGDEWWSQ
jgi:hypothetical protein